MSVAPDASPIDACRALLRRLTIVRDEAERNALLALLKAPQRPEVLSFLNQHAFNLSWTDTGFRQSLSASDILLRDGVGVSVALSMLKQTPGLNLNGTDLIPVIADLYAGRTVMVLGTAQPYADRAADVLRARGCRVVGVMTGFDEDDVYVAEVKRQKPDLVILGMGMPKQERIAIKLSHALDHPMLIVNGGAILDFMAGRFQRAPRLVQSMRMEWAFRLLKEPRRLANRYIAGGVAFIARILWLRLSKPAKPGRTNGSAT